MMHTAAMEAVPVVEVIVDALPVKAPDIQRIKPKETKMRITMIHQDHRTVKVDRVIAIIQIMFRQSKVIII